MQWARQSKHVCAIKQPCAPLGSGGQGTPRTVESKMGVEARTPGEPGLSSIAAFIRRRPFLNLAAAGAVTSSLLSFTFSPQAVYTAPAAPDAAEQHKRAGAASRDYPLTANLHRASPVHHAPASESATASRYIGSGLAENSWNFEVPDGVPGFGPLDPAEARRIVDLLAR
jgi:hypothetical protein